MTQAEYDPERALWLPGRRKFFLMAGAAFAGLFLPEPSWIPATLYDEFDIEIGGVKYRFYEKPFDGSQKQRVEQRVETTPWMRDKPLSLSPGAPTTGWYVTQDTQTLRVPSTKAQILRGGVSY